MQCVDVKSSFKIRERRKLERNVVSDEVPANCFFALCSCKLYGRLALAIQIGRDASTFRDETTPGEF